MRSLAPASRAVSATAKVAVATIVLVILAVGITQVSPFFLPPSHIVVSGTATTPGLGSDKFQYSVYGTNITFTSDTGAVYKATVSEGNYTITLPNDHVYGVLLVDLGDSLTCSAGILDLSQGPGGAALTKNWTC